MHELVYVLTVEAFCFGLLGVVLVAQTLDIFALPANKVWPVLSASLFFILAYVLFLLVTCCAISVGKFGVLAHGMMDACARSAGRLVYVVVLSVCYVTILLLYYDSNYVLLNYDLSSTNKTTENKKHSVQCLLAQLCGTSCSGAVLWSYSAYLSIMIPVMAFIAALQVTAAGMCKNSKKSSHARLSCVNCAYVLVYTVNYTLGKNTLCYSACVGAAVFRQPREQVQYSCYTVVWLLMSLCTSDIVAEYFLRRSNTQLRRFCCVPRSFAHIFSVGMFCFLRFAQLVSVPLFDILLSSSVPSAFWRTWNLQTTLPWQLLMVHTIIASVMCVIDIMQIVVPFISNVDRSKSQQPDSSSNQHKPKSSQLKLPQQTVVKPSAPTVASAGLHRPFELDTGIRRKFMMTFNGHSRWPTMHNVDTGKKKT